MILALHIAAFLAAFAAGAYLHLAAHDLIKFWQRWR
jgi:hypothetical protein